MTINMSKHGAKRGIVSGIISSLAALGAASIPLIKMGQSAALVTYAVAFLLCYQYVRRFVRPSETAHHRKDTENEQ